MQALFRQKKYSHHTQLAEVNVNKEEKKNLYRNKQKCRQYKEVLFCRRGRKLQRIDYPNRDGSQDGVDPGDADGASAVVIRAQDSPSYNKMCG